MKTNVGGIDKILRIVVGLALIAWVLLLGGPVWAWIGVVPLATMFGYVNDLRSRTQGRATYSMQFSHYDEVPAQISEEIVAKARGQ